MACLLMQRIAVHVASDKMLCTTTYNVVPLLYIVVGCENSGGTEMRGKERPVLFLTVVLGRASAMP